MSRFGFLRTVRVQFKDGDSIEEGVRATIVAQFVSVDEVFQKSQRAEHFSWGCGVGVVIGVGGEK
jgi:hypothetical protein